MTEQARNRMAQGSSIACQYICDPDGFMTKAHYHNYYELYFLEEGQCCHMLQDRIYTLGPGDLILFSPYVMHRSFQDSNALSKRLLLYFQADQVDSPELLTALDRGNGVYSLQPGLRRPVQYILKELLSKDGGVSDFEKSYCHTLLNTLLFMIILQAAKQEPKPLETPSRISQIVRYIHSHYDEDIRLELLARTFYISPYYLCREFKRYTNSTLVQYLNITRIMNAQKKFLETDKNITEISRETGFTNITHFNRVFKNITGMTPSGYRKNRRNLIGEYGGILR